MFLYIDEDICGFQNGGTPIVEIACEHLFHFQLTKNLLEPFFVAMVR